MDEQRFDQIAKRLGASRTRRATLKGLGVALLGAAGVATGLEVEAKGKGKGKHHRSNDPVQTICVPDVGGDCSSLPCCTGLDCESDHTCQCHLGACHTDSECTCAHVTTCGTFGDTNGQCCRTEIGFYCDTTNIGNNCCAPAYICDPHGAGCQCNTAAGFIDNNGTCACPAGQHVSDAGQCVADTTCIQPGQTCNACHQCCAGSTCTDPTHACDGSGGTCCLNNGQQGNVNHPDLCCSGCVCPDGNCCAASHCQQPQCTGTGQGSCGANQLCCNNTCVPNDATNCGTCGNQCSADQTCNGTTCCLANGQPGNANHPDLCCSGCVCPDGNCCDVSHCQQPQCNAPLIPCGTECINPDNQCCAEDAIGVLCPPDPRGQRKCCPAGHTCNPNKNGTFNCGLGQGARSRHSRGRNRR